MGTDIQSDSGLFAGTDAAICCVLGKEVTHFNQLKQRTTYRRIASRPVPEVELVELTRRLFQLIGCNLNGRRPSEQNWRWERQIAQVNPKNRSPEIVIERAVAFLAENKLLKDASGHEMVWCNQIPVASGLINGRAHKRAAVDLATILDGKLELYELKWKTDTPVYAAFEILRYGLAYLLCRTKLAYAGPTMTVHALGLNVLAPHWYYETEKGEEKILDLTWLQAGLDAGIRAVAQEEVKRPPNFQASFRFLALPLGREKLFANVADAKACCDAKPLGSNAAALVQAMSKLSPVFPRPRSA